MLEQSIICSSDNKYQSHIGLTPLSQTPPGYIWTATIAHISAYPPKSQTTLKTTSRDHILREKVQKVSPCINIYLLIPIKRYILFAQLPRYPP